MYKSQKLRQKEPPTDKQLLVICRIEDELGLKFQGKTYKDAHRFIDENIDDCRGVYRRRNVTGKRQTETAD